MLSKQLLCICGLVVLAGCASTSTVGDFGWGRDGGDSNPNRELPPVIPRVSATYDKFDDETTVRTDPASILGQAMPSYLSDEHWLAFSLSVTLTGDRSVSRPDEAPPISMALISESPVWRYAKSHRLVLLLDGQERMDLGHGVRRTEVVRASEVYVVETMGFVLTQDQLRQLTASAKVDGTLGNTEFTLGSGHLGVVRDFHRKVFPPPDSL